MIWERPRRVEERRETGHWEIDTMMGESPGEGSHCVLTLVERKSGYLIIGKLQARTAAETNRALLGLMARNPGKMRTITADNGTEFHWYGEVEAVSPVKFYFATPHHSWERGTNENTNGLLRQYLPKGATMARITQKECDLIAAHLNNRPRKRHGYKTPKQCFLQTSQMLHFKVEPRRIDVQKSLNIGCLCMSPRAECRRIAECVCRSGVCEAR
jgi:IS30 family transposase